MSYIGNPINSVAFLTDQFSGNGSTTAFTMSVAPANTGSVLVAVSGVLQDPSTYAVNGTTLTFSAAPPSGTANISVRYLGIPASGVTNTAYRTLTEFTATAGQTTFSVPSYTVGYINVYRNGVMLGSADFTASSGTSIVLAAGASAGDLITTESFYVSSVLNAIPATAGSVQQTYLAPNVAGNGPAFSAWKGGTNQTGISSATWTKVTLGAEEFDTNSNFDTSLARFTPTVAGYYQFNWQFDIGGVSTTLNLVDIYKNGARVKRSNGISVTNGENYVSGAAMVYLNGATDYVELYVYISGAGATVYGGAVEYSWFQGFLARAA